MLLNLHINNIALIDNIDIEFNEGLNILTGETGAGKSIIIGSIGICLGGKFSKDLLRDENKDGVVELLFTVDNETINKKLLEMEIDVGDDKELLIQRRLVSSGRTINRINESTVTTAKLKEVAAILIDLHAQHEQQTLMKASRHLEILDRYGAGDIRSQKEIVEEIYREYVRVQDELSGYNIGESERKKQIDFLKYQMNEIESANLKSGEDDDLEAVYRKMVNSKEILSIADEVYSVTGYSGTSNFSDAISRSLVSLKHATTLDEDISGICDILQDIDGMLNDFNRELSSYMSDLEFDQSEFTEVTNRLNLINSLKAKYGSSIDEILNSYLEFEAEINRLVSYEEEKAALEAKLEKLHSTLEAESNSLTDIRKKFAISLCKLITESLEELNFMHIEFDMHFEKSDKYTSNGNDSAYFMISTNVGESMRPLYEVASGGELSRVMLAIKSSLAYEDDTPTLIFDEIDVGISGMTAQKVAEKMSIISRNHQVICITHLPQIAAMSDHHFIIEKNVEKNKTVTNIRKLSKDEEIKEIARLLGGVAITDATISNAIEMKGLAERTKIY